MTDRMKAPIPTPVFRLVHVDCLATFTQRGAIHAPNTRPSDGLAYRSTHDSEVQRKRSMRRIPCGPRGDIGDYVSFYFGPRGPMLYRLKIGSVQGYHGGQEPMIYLVAHAQDLVARGCRVVFSDGHGLAVFTRWFDDLDALATLDWDSVYAKLWKDTDDYPDRRRRKQAEFLVHREVPSDSISEVSVATARMQRFVEQVFDSFPGTHRPVVAIRPRRFYN